MQFRCADVRELWGQVCVAVGAALHLAVLHINKEEVQYTVKTVNRQNHGQNQTFTNTLVSMSLHASLSYLDTSVASKHGNLALQDVVLSLHFCSSLLQQNLN